MLEETPLSRTLVGSYVDTYLFPNGQFDVRSKGIKLDYRVFDKDQRVTHANIVDNKRLGHVLQFIKEQQEADDELKAKAKKVGKQRTRYKKKRDNKDPIEQPPALAGAGLAGS